MSVSWMECGKLIVHCLPCSCIVSVFGGGCGGVEYETYLFEGVDSVLLCIVVLSEICIVVSELIKCIDW